jgi:bifunctional enzyme CysN/CysC
VLDVSGARDPQRAGIASDGTTHDAVTGAAAMNGGARSGGVGQVRSTNVFWSPSALTRSERWRSLGQSGATLWITGLPASGKSTLANEVERRLITTGRLAYRLDGDNLRHGLNGDLGFDPAGRTENVRRTAHVAALLADAGGVAIVSLVSPYAADRAAARAIHDKLDVPFVEVFVDTPLVECERRDPKGLYAKARRCEISGFTGVSDPYEPPAAPESRITGAEGSLAQQALAVVVALEGASPREARSQAGVPARV